VSRRRAAPLAAAVLITCVVATGCGKDVTTESSSVPTPSVGITEVPIEEAPPVDPETGEEIKLEKPQAASTILPSATMTAVPGTGTIYSSADARTVRGFPVPQGAKVKSPGAAEETWQFDIATDNPDEVIEFYKQVLPQMGYTVRTDVTYTQAYEEVFWDLVFDGTVSGSIVADPRNGTVFVVVNPPGQPAFTGDVEQ